jgi:hypothetical protein
MRDYSLINSQIAADNQAAYKAAFNQLINISQSNFQYA